MLVPHPEDLENVRRGFEEEPVDDETAAAFMRWFETGEGECPRHRTLSPQFMRMAAKARHMTGAENLPATMHALTQDVLPTDADQLVVIPPNGQGWARRRGREPLGLLQVQRHRSGA